MSGSRTKTHSTVRNIHLYHELVFNRRTQAAVASQFGVSQPRVALIRRHVADWVDRLTARILDQVPKNSAAHKRRIDLGFKLHLAIAIRRLHLMHAYGDYLDCWGGQPFVLELGPLLDAWDAGTLHEEIVALLPPRDLVSSAVRMARELETLARIASHGPFFDLPEQICASECSKTAPARADANTVAHPSEVSV